MRVLFLSIFLFLNLFGTLATMGQSADSLSIANVPSAPTKQISLLTCGVGDELYSSFGHTAIRVKDFKNGSDVVYNYGTFNFNDSLFYVKFTLGKLEYYLAKDYYLDFVAAYQYDGRSVKEQELALSSEDAEKLYHFLEYNVLPQNRNYKYDFVHDNCATRVRDAFEQSLGTSFVWGNVVGNKEVSYRNIINEYLANNHWSRLGINILLGSNIDSNMTERTAMFIPDVLFNGLASAKLASQPIVKSSTTILQAQPRSLSVNSALVVGVIVLFLAVLVYNVRSLEPIRLVFSRIVLFTMGLLGVLILFMWLGTEHQACNNNFNILWAVPTHFIIAFVNFKSKSCIRLYAMASISLLIVAILVHILGIQVMPLIELIPWLMVLMLIYIDMYKRSLVTSVAPSK